MREIWRYVMVSVWLVSSMGAGAQGVRQQASRAAADQSPRIEMANVMFRYSESVGALVTGLDGTLVPSKGHAVPDFNDPESFLIAARAAEMRMSTTQLAALMNGYLLGPKAQIKDVRLAVENGKLMMRGTMRKGIRVPFEATAGVSLTPDGRVRVAIETMRTAKIPVKGLMDALGLQMDDLVSQKGLRGVSVDGDALLIDPQTAFPPPQIRAKITGVKLQNQSVVMEFGGGAPRMETASSGGRNYIAVHGGTIRYGREQMSNTDLVMVDTTEKDPFDFYLRQYKRQFAAGTIHAQNDMALRAFLPDYGKLGRRQ